MRELMIILTICISGYLSIFGAPDNAKVIKPMEATSADTIYENHDNAITLKFKEHSDNAEIAGILGALDASQVTVTFYADADSLDAKHYEIWMVERNESEAKHTKLGYKSIHPDSTKIIFTALAKDSLNAVISLAGLSAGIPRVQVNIPTDNRSLIGCDFEWTFGENDTIPLLGYATGIPMEVFFNGEPSTAFHVCGLRYSKVQPYNWKEKYDLPDYIYFEAIPVKKMNFDFD